MRLNLDGKTALVTGGSGSIGRAVCLDLARCGVKTVAFTYFSNHDGADETAKLLTDMGCTPEVIRANLNQDAAPEEIVEAVRARMDRIDIFVSNAASGVLKPAIELRRKHWKWTMGVNAKAMLFLTQGLVGEGPDGAAPLMGEGGRIIALSSLGAVRAIPEYAIVGASKAALEALVRSLAAELGPRGITANVISPGVVDTFSLQQFPNSEMLLQMAEMRTPMGRIATPDDVGKLVAFVASPLASMITGQTLVVDGGYSMLA
ncbi:MAG: enoyl-[acyl-carrier protein] reductase III [Bradymonadia bacterium]|jgi:enoyl-[acyl-carrier protein] reductase III